MPVSSNIATVLTRGAEHAFYFCNWSDPYLLFTRGMSDVKLTDDWSEYFYEIRKELPYGRFLYKRSDPQDVEVYQLALAEGEAAWRQVDALEFLGYYEALQAKAPWHELHDVAVTLVDSVDDELGSCGLHMMLDEVEYDELKSFCTYRQAGITHVDICRMEFYVQFSAWAALIWLLSPLSREYRYKASELYRVVIDCGEALLTEHSIFGRGDYRKTSRPVFSCYRCGIQSWCLEATSNDGLLDHICEACVSAGMPVLPPANCGSRLCRLPQCKHHPMHAFDPNRRLHETMRTVGQLTAQMGAPSLLSGRKNPQGLLR